MNNISTIFSSVCGSRFDAAIHKGCGFIGISSDTCFHFGCCWKPCLGCVDVPYCYELKHGIGILHHVQSMAEVSPPQADSPFPFNRN